MKITLCYTQTLDGRLATRTGQSQWLGAGESLEFAHHLRASHDAIMVGVGTVLADNPRLTVRLVPGRDPLRVVVDSHLRTPLTAHVLSESLAPGTMFAVTHVADQARIAQVSQRGATIIICDSTPAQQVDLHHLITQLANRGITSLMVEGGAQLITSLLRLRLATRLVVTLTPKVMGSGIEAIGDLGISALGQLLTLQSIQLQHFGPDIVVDGMVVYP